MIEKDTEFSLDEAKKFLLSSPSRKNLTISGGEPTIHKDFLEIVKFAKRHFESISLMTNGIRFGDMDFLKATIDAGADRIYIPFYSPNEEEHNWMVGNPNAYQKVLKGFANVNALLNERRFNVQIKFLLAKFTYKRIPDSIDFIANNFPKIKRVSLYGFHIGSKALQHKDLCVINYNESRPYNDKSVQKFLDYGLCFNVCQIPFCAFSEEIIEVLLKENRIIYPEDSFLKRPDRNAHLESSPEYSPKECENCSLNEFCPKIYGKNAASFEYRVRPIVII